MNTHYRLSDMHIPIKPRMTFANRITIARLAAIPVVIALLLVYGNSISAAGGNAAYRWAAAWLFIAIFIFDIIDGAIARLFNQITLLGSILDPVADKALVISSLVTLCMLPQNAFPISVPQWFSLTVIVRDIILITCTSILFRVNTSAVIKPRILGKAATFFNAIAIGLVLTGWLQSLFLPVAACGAICTAFSGVIYIIDGIRQVNTPQIKADALRRQNST